MEGGHMTKRKRKSWRRRPIWLYIIVALVLLYLIFPIIVVVPMSFSNSELIRFNPDSVSLRWYRKFFSDSKWLKAAFTSLKIAAGTVCLSGVLGIVAAIGLSRPAMKRSGLLKLILQLPMMLPAVIVAVAMYLVMGKWGLVGTYPGIILAHTCLALPYVVTLVSSALTGVNPSYYNAARVMGASHWTAVRKVILPLIRPAIFSSMLFGFITSWDETVVVLFLTNSKTMTLPRLIYAELKYGISPIIAAISSLLICLTLCAFLLSRLISANSQQSRALRAQKRMEKQAVREREQMERAHA